MISIPSRMRKYGKSDEIVGHVRRYEKADLTAMLERCGYTDIQIASYGFPLTEITRRVSNWLVKNERAHEELSMEQRSTQSSFRRPRVIDIGVALFGGELVGPFCFIQRMFYRTDLGDGYVVSAREERRTPGHMRAITQAMLDTGSQERASRLATIPKRSYTCTTGARYS